MEFEPKRHFLANGSASNFVAKEAQNWSGGDGRIRILIAAMIAGNPKRAHSKAFCAVALAILIVVTLAVLATRKKTPPARVAPLHPSTFIPSVR